MKKLALTVLCLLCVVFPVNAQIPGLTEGLISGLLGGMAARSVTANAVPPGAAWSQDMYVSHLTDVLPRGKQGVRIEDKRLFPITAKSIIWAGESLFLVSPRPVKAAWFSPGGKFAETKVVRYGKDVYRAVLLNKKDGLSRLQGRWEVKILSATGQVVDDQFFFVGRASMEEDSKALEAAGQFMDLSKEDAVVQFSKREVILLDQFGSLERITKRIKLLSDKGRELVEVFLPFVPGLQGVTVNYAYTIKPDGSIVDAREYGARTFAKSYPDYSAFQFFNMTLPSLEKGCIVEYQILIATPISRAHGMFFDATAPQGQMPVLKATYTLNAAKDMGITYRSLNAKFDVSQEDLPEGRKMYRISAGPLRGIKVEPAMPPRRDVVGEAIFTTAKSWDDIAAWWSGLIKDKAGVTPEIQAYAQDLVKGASSEEEKIRRLFSYVSSSVRYVGLDFGADVYSPASAAEVFKNKYGDCKDQSMLLLAMLKAGGVEAHTALAQSGYGNKVQKDIPSLDEFNHVIVVAEAGGKKYYLDPTLKKYPFAVLPAWMQNRYLMHVKNGAAVFEFLPLSDAGSHQTVTDIDLSMDSDLKINGVFKAVWKGAAGGDVRQFLYQLNSSKQKEEFADQVLKDVYPYAIRDSFTLDGEDNVDLPLTLRVTFHMQNWLLEAGKGSYLLHLYGGEVKTPDYLTQSRVYPAVLDYLSSRIVHVRLKLPAGYDAEVPDPLDLVTPHLENHVHYTLQGGVLSLDQSLANSSVLVPLDMMDAVRGAWEKIAQVSRRGILIKKHL